MAIYTLSDPHLSLSCEKPMDVFGGRWTNYVEKLSENLSKLSADDTLIMPGDISWAMHLDELDADFGFLSSFPFRKIIGKGNHDYWWSTVSKLNKYISEKGFSNISFLYNNAYLVEDTVISGSRGWYLDAAVAGCDNKKIIARECIRLDMSIKAGEKLCIENGIVAPTVFMHYPPVHGDYVCGEIIDVLNAHGIKECYYGHLHGNCEQRLVENYGGIHFTLCSADHLSFKPLKIN